MPPTGLKDPPMSNPDLRHAANAIKSATAQLGAFVAGFDGEDLPKAMRHEAKRAILNFFGVALGGWFDSAGETAIKVITHTAGKPTATVIGSALRFDILNASFMNALNANVLEFDDTHMPTVVHPTAPVAPPLFALAENTRVSGSSLIEAFVLGVEVACRAGNSVSPQHYVRGRHITATCGVLGAAAACARLLALSAEQTAHAIGIAASQAAGLVENLPTGAKNIQVGNCARGGLLSALFSQQGYTAAPQAIEGTHGWARASGDAPDMNALLGRLGQTWELGKNAYKAYPCGIVLAPVIDACVDLRREHLLSPGDIMQVMVRGNTLLLARADRPHVLNDRIAKLSIQHSAAIAFVCSAITVKEYAAFDDPEVVAFRSKVTVQADDALPIEAAIVTVLTKGGQSFTAHVEHARGSLERPLTDIEIDRKARQLADLGGTDVDIAPLIDAVWGMDANGDVGQIMKLTVPRSKG
jgi:2-methylcitrate dehydratase PrpD